MASVLLTAFEPYDHWQTNASWLALVELTKNLPDEPNVTTRLYPVDYATVKEKLDRDLEANFDYALHLGQAPRVGCIQLESIALNIAGRGGHPTDPFVPLVDDAPLAYQSPLPLMQWAEQLRENGIPAQVSHHAGTFLCNAALYYSLHTAERNNLQTQAAFIHLPLESTQASAEPEDVPSMPTKLAAEAIRLILRQLANAGDRGRLE